jgi:hypothetical protein
VEWSTSVEVHSTLLVLWVPSGATEVAIRTPIMVFCCDEVVEDVDFAVRLLAGSVVGLKLLVTVERELAEEPVAELVVEFARMRYLLQDSLANLLKMKSLWR